MRFGASVIDHETMDLVAGTTDPLADPTSARVAGWREGPRTRPYGHVTAGC